MRERLLEEVKVMAEEGIVKVVWMNWKIEVERGRMVWELFARLILEHTAEVWLTGRAARKNLFICE